MMKIRVQQLNPTIGDLQGNTAAIIAAMSEAEEASADLLILPELCTCGYPPEDLLERKAFRERIARANDQIVGVSGDTAVIFGTVASNPGTGRPCYNVALMAHKGRQVAQVNKALLPTYDVFDEDRYFERAREFSCVEWQGLKMGVTVCEDIWANNSRVQYHTYALDPVQALISKGAELIINISASPFTDTKCEERLRMLKGHAERTGKPVFYANQAGGNTGLISDGDSMVLDAAGNIVARAALFEEDYIDVRYSDGSVEPWDPSPVHPVPDRTERIFEALKRGLKDYMRKTGVTDQVVLGLSGGIDSALVACIAADALGSENVMGIAMPSEFSSDHSISDARRLAENLGIEFHQLPIKSLYGQYLDTLEPLFEDTGFGVAEENLQSRSRGVLLMAVANKFNRFVLNTGNKSELATGYCTLYGDMNGAVAVIGDLYKTEVYELSRWLNQTHYGREVIPQSVMEKPPSAELRPDQKDSDSLPEYDKLDTILKLYIEEQCSVGEIADQGFGEKMVQRIIRLVDSSEYKRYQAPPVLKIHAKSFGPGRRWPLVNGWSSL